jgi:DtxR family Mn-dependent transcriptional regulator
MTMSTDTRHPTEAEEMYLITIARAVEDGATPPVAVSEIARDLEVTPVAANQMIKKLEAAGHVDYTPYKGVSLTESGGILASTVLRNRRLWGLFLSEHLGLTPEHADEVACEMEHITPDTVAVRLAEFLGSPSFGPTGKPIPSVGGRTDTFPLNEVAAGMMVEIVDVASPFDAFLESQGAAKGAVVSVLASAPDGTVVLETAGGPLQLAPDAAESIVVAVGG